MLREQIRGVFMRAIPGKRDDHVILVQPVRVRIHHGRTGFFEAGFQQIHRALLDRGVGQYGRGVLDESGPIE